MEIDCCLRMEIDKIEVLDLDVGNKIYLFLGFSLEIFRKGRNFFLMGF